MGEAKNSFICLIKNQSVVLLSNARYGTLDLP